MLLITIYHYRELDYCIKIWRCSRAKLWIKKSSERKQDWNFPTDDRLDLSITVVTFPLTCIGMTVDKNHIKWWGNIGCCIKFYLHFFLKARITAILKLDFPLEAFKIQLFSRLFSFPVPRLFVRCLAYIIPRKAASKGGMEKYNTAMMDIQNTFRSSTKVQNKMGVRYTIHGFRTKTAKLDQHRSYIFVVFKVKNSNSNETFF